ncbi:MAG TPA: hypothetical protein VNL73_03080 [Verrucomicrobiae bacterium]|nr:hypothetical protein [Verrucomicrobiae bacterium]
MFIGHYGVALGLKKADKGISLGLLFLAVQFVDILWTVLVLLGIEKVEISPGITAANPLDFVYYPFTHSLLMSLIWAGLAYLLFRILPAKTGWQKSKVASIIAIAVLSHFFLDLLVHRPDLPLAFGTSSPKLGIGLWNYPAAAYLLESAIFLVGAWIYLKTTKPASKLGKYGMPVFALLLLIFNLLNLFGPPPPKVQMVAASGFVMYFVLAGAAFWLDKKRS